MIEDLRRLDIPLLREAADALKREGRFRTDLTPDQVRQIMTSIIGQLIAQQAHAPEVSRQQIAATLSDLRVAIEEPRVGSLVGVVAGPIRITQPSTITLAVDCRLGNSPTRPNQLELSSFSIGGAGIFDDAKLAAWQGLNGRDIQAEGQTFLSRPNQAFGSVLQPAFAAQGVELTGLGLRFNPGSLAMALSGHAIPLPPPPSFR